MELALKALTVTWSMALEALEGQRDAWADRVRQYLTATGVVPEWIERHFERARWHEYKFCVSHNGQRNDIWSVSAKEAANTIRFNLYDLTPFSELPPFEVKAYFPNMDNALAKSVGNADESRRRVTPVKISMLAERLARFAR